MKPMRYLELTLATPEENLALDEALLEEAEASPSPMEALRVWESLETVVVVGRSTRIEEEVNLTFCREQGIPVLRRPSGGAAVVLGAGCLMYALVLSRELRPEIRRIDAAHRYVLGKTAAALNAHVPGVACAGTSDLVLTQGGSSDVPWLKFSGNSVRVKRRHLLYHGTLLYDFAFDRISQCLSMPPRMPAYRAGRGHDRFLANLPLARPAICSLLSLAWLADTPANEWPSDRTALLVAEKYCRESWNQGNRAIPQ